MPVFINKNRYTGKLQADLSPDMSPMKAQHIPEKPRQGWLSTLDMRTAVGRDMRGRYAEVCGDLGGEDALSYAQRSLVERALWLEYWIAQQERALAEGAEVDMGRLTQAGNSLLGLFRTLGLERRQRDVTSLSDYIATRGAG